MNEINYTGVGLNTDSTESQIKKGQLTFAMNAVVESFDGKMVTYQNESSNKFVLSFADGLKPIGIYHITNMNRVVYFLTNGVKHQIAYVDQGKNEYTVLIDAPCLNFSLDHPIHQVVVKTTNCGVEVYWTDAYNQMRFFNFEDLPFREVSDPDNDYKRIKIEGDVDCNKMLAQPNFRIPKVESTDVVEGGVIKEGSYQFVVQYANSLGQGYSQYYNVSNPISIVNTSRASENFDLPTSKAVKILVSNLDTTGLFDYFNVVVVENINGISTPKLVGTYPVVSETYEVVYTGSTNQSINISMEELFQKYQKYDVAGGVTSTDDRIVWYDLKENHRVNYQKMVSKIPVKWETIAIPYDSQNAYHRELNTEKYKGYMGDEVYPLFLVFINKNGRESDRFLLSGREATTYDRQFVNGKERWLTENTASISITHTHQDYEPFQTGEFSYWESEERYPNNFEIWGDLSGKKIRYHKFPDETISPRFNKIGDFTYIYPKGIKIEKSDIINAIANSDLTQEQKDSIIGFKVVRGDRSSGNSSIVAKGHFTNVGKYKESDSEYYFSNYPYNSLQDDPLFASTEMDPLVGYSRINTAKPFDENPLNRLTFHSPDTHFSQPFGVDTGHVKLEAIDYGKTRIHFDKIDDNAEYKFLTKETLMVSVGLAAGVAFDYSRNGVPSFNGTDALQVFQSNMTLFEKLAPYTNFGYNINSVAKFDQSVAISNDEQKIFPIEFGKYLNSEFNTIDEGKLINNKYRESSVFLKISDEVKPAHKYDDEIPVDNSRVIASERAIRRVISLEDFLTKLKNNDNDAVSSFMVGTLNASLDLAEGSDNKALALLPTLGRLSQYILDNGSASDILLLKDRQQDCGTNNCYNTISSNTTPQVVPQVVNTTVALYLPFSEVNDIVEDKMDFESTVFDNVLPSICSNQDVNVLYQLDNYVMTQAQLDYFYPIWLSPAPGDEESEDNSIKVMTAVASAFYGRQTDVLCGGAIQNAVYESFMHGIEVYSDMVDILGAKQSLATEREREVNAYYGSIKKDLVSQWGRVNSFDIVDTGVYFELTDDEYPTIFGGDTFINEFAFKTKLPVYKQSTVNTPDNADIALDEEGNLGNPMFWLSTKPLAYDFQFKQRDLEMSLGAIGLTNIKAYVGSIVQSLGSAIMGVGGLITLTTGITGIGAVVGIVVTAVGAILSVAGAIFKNVRSKLTKASINLYKSLFTQIIEKVGVKNINLDMLGKKGIVHQGLLYQYVYGIPTYFVESQVNVDMRQATNDREGNFFPRVGTGIPDDWLQEKNVPIAFDNIYHYNKTFSKQNKENFYSHLREDYDFTKTCFREYPNRAMWSDKTNLNETLNNWLVYRPLNQFDFPKEHGELTALNGILNRQVLARFENKSQLYNTMTTLDASTNKVYVGSNELFKNSPPLDIVDTDTGSMGSQHKWLIRSDVGIVYIDCIRGQIVLMQGNNPKVISDIDNEKFFKDNLPFYITKHFPGYDTDNHFKDVGLHGVYDTMNKRLIITKKDYELLDENVELKNGKFYVGDREVFLDGPEFCDRSWTMSFSFRTNSWTSWHSYTPNAYVAHSTYFQSVSDSSVWSHGLVYDSYGSFFDRQEPYILEYPFTYKQQDEILQTVRDYSTTYTYENKDVFYETDDVYYFNKAFIRSSNQNSGLLNLIPRPVNDMRAYSTYPKYNLDSKDILISKKDGIISFNTFWDITKDRKRPTIKMSCNKLEIELDNNNLDYGVRNFNKSALRSKDLKIRLIRDEKTDFKLVSNFVITQSQDSII